jgi:hypothetical protein
VFRQAILFQLRSPSLDLLSSEAALNRAVFNLSEDAIFLGDEAVLDVLAAVEATLAQRADTEKSPVEARTEERAA